MWDVVGVGWGVRRVWDVVRVGERKTNMGFDRSRRCRGNMSMGCGRSGRMECNTNMGCGKRG